MLRRPISLQTRFAVVFGVIFLVLTITLSLLVGRKASTQVEGEIGQSLGEAASHVAEVMDRAMWSRKGEISLLTTLDAIREPTDVNVARSLLNTLKANFPTVSWVGLMDATGKVVAATDNILEGADIHHRPVFAEGSKGVFIGDVHDAVLLAKLLPNPSGEPMKFVDIAVATMGRDGKMSGVLGAHLSWEWAREVERSVLAPIRERRSIEAFVISSDGTILLGPERMIGQKPSLSVLDLPRGTRPGWAIETWSDGEQRYLTGYAHANGYGDYAGLGWTILVRQPLEQAYAPARVLRAEILTYGIMFSFLLAVGGWLVAGWIAAPLGRIVAAADRIRLGDEEVSIPVEDSVLEIKQLSSSLRALVDSLTHKQQALDHMEDRAHHDTLTGLPNRAFLSANLPALAARMSRDGGAIACLYLDLDGFKPVNDTYGHHAGDLLLCEVGNRLRSTARGGDLVARLGGDEFVVILSVIGPIRDHAQMVAGRIIRALSQPVELEEHRVSIGCSIGIGLWPEDGKDMETVTKAADCALYGAKRGGKNRAMFADEVTNCIVPASERLMENQG